MKKFYFLLFALCLFTGVNAQIITIPDATFKAKLLSARATSNQIAKNLNGDWFRIDSNYDQEFQLSELMQVSYLNINASFGIASLEGIRSFGNLKYLNCGNAQGDIRLTSLDVSGLNSLETLICSDNFITTMNIDGLTNLKFFDCTYNLMTSLSVTNLPNLESLYCENNQLTSLNVSGLPSLWQLFCENNQIPTLNLSGSFPSLRTIICDNNQLTSLYLDPSINLWGLRCENNHLTAINGLTGMSYLNHLYCKNNQITSLTINGPGDFGTLSCGNNPMTSLNLSNLPNFEYFYCENTLLSSLDLNEFPMLRDIRISNNSALTEIFYKNGIASYSNFQIANCPNLRFICVDEWKIPSVTNSVAYYGYSTTCNVNSYCSFTPGGTYYTIQGINRFDTDNNGCDASDIIIPNLKFSLSNGSVTGSHFSSQIGTFSFPVGAGTHTMTPVLENPNYFTFSPSNISINFPTQASPFTQNFCLIPNNNHPDLEMVLLPINAARPGFVAKYKIIYKNRGTNSQSGTINLQFNNLISSYNYANPAVNNYTSNSMAWDFINLMPFEIREIEVNLNINAPTSSPAVNAGDVLNYIVNISSAAVDETPNDNTFVLNQIVVNSFDPNDKTCLQGETIEPSKVGEYVHYVIRFENTGTFPAENIVVKDMIDTAKFDINSLVPIKGSHDFFTRINGNKVEFIFENINLDFNDSTNDGYVAFKIKTKPTLVLGNTFSNNANIYFDYNFPITTNTFTTTVAALNTQDFDFGSYFFVYPNPAKDVLHIQNKQDLSVNSVEIYNQLGQIVLAVTNVVNSIDVANLASGTYFVKVNTEKGSSNAKFIKE